MVTWLAAIYLSYLKCSLIFVGCLGSRPNNALVSVHIGDHVVPCVGSVKDLAWCACGWKLKFMTHINKTAAKAQSRSNHLHKCFISKDININKSICHIRPIVECISSILVTMSCWRSKTNWICAAHFHKAYKEKSYEKSVIRWQAQCSYARKSWNSEAASWPDLFV